MDMNRRSFFRLLVRASGTAAAVVVGGAMVLPKVGDEQFDKVTTATDIFEIDGQLCRVNHIYQRTVLRGIRAVAQTV